MAKPTVINLSQIITVDTLLPNESVKALTDSILGRVGDGLRSVFCVWILWADNFAQHDRAVNEAAQQLKLLRYFNDQGCLGMVADTWSWHLSAEEAYRKP